ncbi:GNAT family N-acetyltransferase [Bacillus sp. FJAT-42376]|uniref:GNAT family N-acetyltransferase n=1 Tax=Bacillus sp. FJAT-42376 TaxID=2014076 RepID=UPI000F4F1698|nr:GNAT family N-acetyltransferase [Bacillus sp. FJAT-42376]AZB42557.1 GNAT family N-acetyltransferase [Bacillus sp. FJAT-42376]
MIQPLLLEDAGSHLKLLLELDEGTQTMLYEPGERSSDYDAYTEKLKNALNKEIFVWVSKENERLQGFIMVIPGMLQRNRHKAAIVLGVLPHYQKKGIGGRLIDAAIDWGQKQNLHRLELTVMAHNQPAIALYLKKQFEIEGTIRHSLFVDGEWVDEYMMGRLL